MISLAWVVEMVPLAKEVAVPVAEEEVDTSKVEEEAKPETS